MKPPYPGHRVEKVYVEGSGVWEIDVEAIFDALKMTPLERVERNRATVSTILKIWEQNPQLRRVKFDQD